MDAWRQSLEEQLTKCERGDAAHRSAALLLRAELAISPCECLSLEHGSNRYQRRNLGCDEDDADLAIDTCTRCGRVWIHYFYEDGVHRNSGRWYRGLIDLQRAASLDANAARTLLEQLPWRLCGGLFFSGQRFVTTGKLIRM